MRRHAWEAHGIAFSTEEALAVLLRLELDVGEAEAAEFALVPRTTRGKEH